MVNDAFSKSDHRKEGTEQDQLHWYFGCSEPDKLLLVQELDYYLHGWDLVDFKVFVIVDGIQKLQLDVVVRRWSAKLRGLAFMILKEPIES